MINILGVLETSHIRALFFAGRNFSKPRERHSSIVQRIKTFCEHVLCLMYNTYKHILKNPIQNLLKRANSILRLIMSTDAFLSSDLSDQKIFGGFP